MQAALLQAHQELAPARATFPIGKLNAWHLPPSLPIDTDRDQHRLALVHAVDANFLVARIQLRLHQTSGHDGRQHGDQFSEGRLQACRARHELTLRRYWTNACESCVLKHRYTTGKQRRITRREHEHLLDEVQRRLDENPQAMRQRRETVEHPFGTMKARMGATHFLTKTLPKVAAEMALSVLAYNLTRVMNVVGVKPLMAAIAA
jgi:DDE family transposase